MSLLAEARQAAQGRQRVQQVPVRSVVEADVQGGSPRGASCEGSAAAGHCTDFGRERETRDISDRYRFRTPSLLNVAVTAPYGHAGAYETLDQVMAHYDDPHGTVRAFFNGGGACALEQFRARRDCSALYPRARANTTAALARLDSARAGSATRFADTRLNETQRDDLVAFMHALTDPCVLDRSCLAPWVADPGESVDAHHLRAVDRNGETL